MEERPAFLFKTAVHLANGTGHGLKETGSGTVRLYVLPNAKKSVKERIRRSYSLMTRGVKKSLRLGLGSLALIPLSYSKQCQFPRAGPAGAANKIYTTKNEPFVATAANKGNPSQRNYPRNGQVTKECTPLKATSPSQHDPPSSCSPSRNPAPSAPPAPDKTSPAHPSHPAPPHRPHPPRYRKTQSTYPQR